METSLPSASLISLPAEVLPVENNQKCHDKGTVNTYNI